MSETTGPQNVVIAPRFSASMAVSDEAHGGARPERCPLPIREVEVGASFDEKDGIRDSPDGLIEDAGFGAGRDEDDSISVLGHFPHPVIALPAEGRVEPYAAFPLSGKAILRQNDVAFGGGPSGNSTGIQIEFPERVEDFRRSQPSVGSYAGALM